MQQIGEVLKDKNELHVVVTRSTMLPGSMMNVVILTLEQTCGKKAGVDDGVLINLKFSVRVQQYLATIIHQKPTLEKQRSEAEIF